MEARWPRILAGLMTGALLVGTVFWFASRGGATSGDNKIVYVSSETGRVVAGPAQPIPAVDPETGKPTLLPGVYCPECRRWYAAPPPDHSPGNPKALTCRIHNVPMTTEGPLP